MEITERYKDLIERAGKVTLREGQGYRMLTDNFDPNWKRGEEPHGTMTFTDKPETISLVEPSRNLESEIDDLKAIIANHDTRLKKDIGGHIR